MFSHSETLLLLASLALFDTGRAAPGSLMPGSAHSARTADVCNGGENGQLLCYNSPNSTPQGVAVADVAYIASYLRAYGAQTRSGRLFNMAAADAPDCAEWTLYAHGSALALAKHLDRKANSSVLFADIANTIDGGAGSAGSAGSAQQPASLIDCGTSGGSLGVQVNTSNPAYNASTYPAGSIANGILIKIVASNAQS